MTKEEKKEVKSHKKFWEGKDPIKQVFLSGNISREEFAKEKANANGLSDNDIMWGLLNKKLNSFMKNSDWGNMRLLYYDMAVFLACEGKEFFHILKESHKCDLMQYKGPGIEYVQIITARDERVCDKCLQDGLEFTVDEALQKMPIPVEDCENGDWCRCCYISIRKPA